MKFLFLLTIFLICFIVSSTRLHKSKVAVGQINNEDQQIPNDVRRPEMPDEEPKVLMMMENKLEKELLGSDSGVLVDSHSYN